MQLKEGEPEANFAQKLEFGEGQYAVALSSILLQRSAGRPVVALAAILQHSPEVLLVSEKSGIHNPLQMVGDGRSILLAEAVLQEPGRGTRHCHASKVPLQHEKGGIVWLLAAVEDVTALKVACRRPC